MSHGRLPDLASRFYFHREGAKNAKWKERKKKDVDIKQLTEEMHRLVESKGWYAKESKRPQTPRNLAISLSIEAAEILEHFQFTDEIKDRDELGSELADVTLYLLQLASVSGIDLEQAVLKKIEINKTREWDQ